MGNWISDIFFKRKRNSGHWVCISSSYYAFFPILIINNSCFFYCGRNYLSKHLSSLSRWSQELAPPEWERMDNRNRTQGQSTDLIMPKCSALIRLLALYWKISVTRVEHQLGRAVGPLAGTLNCLMQIKWFPMPRPLKHEASPRRTAPAHLLFLCASSRRLHRLFGWSLGIDHRAETTRRQRAGRVREAEFSMPTDQSVISLFLVGNKCFIGAASPTSLNGGKQLQQRSQPRNQWQGLILLQVL